MITDIPTSDDYDRTGNELLLSAWDKAISLLIERLDSDLEDEDVEDYFNSIQTDLRSATALIQQGIEFYLKGRICEVSPYLLINARPDSWPRDCAKNDIPFSTFRTLDAQDLAKVVNTVCDERLSDEFITWFTVLREKRNKIMHSARGTPLLTEIEVARMVLEATHLLHKGRSWMEVRKTSLINSTENILMRDHDVEEVVHAAYDLRKIQREFVTAVDSLTPAESIRYFAFDKKKKRYLCSNCLGLREREYFFELKDAEFYFIATAVEEANEQFCCLICKDACWVDMEIQQEGYGEYEESEAEEEDAVSPEPDELRSLD